MGSHCTHHSQFPPMITISTALFACLGLQAAVASPLSQFAETLNTENLEMEVAALKHSMTTLLSAQSVANSMVCTDITGTVSVRNHQVHHIPAMYEGAPPLSQALKLSGRRLTLKVKMELRLVSARGAASRSATKLCMEGLVNTSTAS